MKTKMIDAIFNHISDYANYGWVVQKKQSSTLGFML